MSDGRRHFLPTPPPWSSPIRWVVQFAPVAPFTVAPEKADELWRLSSNVCLDLPDNGAWKFHYAPSTRRITVSRRAFEFLWATAYAYIVFYRRLLEGRLVDKPTLIDLRADAELAGAARLLQWAMEVVLNSDRQEDWPADLPQPVASAARESNELLADELCLCAYAFIFHHELAHHYLGHEPTTEGDIDQEREADLAAADWLLGDLSETDDRFQKRSLGMAVALMAMTGLGIHSRQLVSKTHPRPFDRMVYSLERHIQDRNHRTWGFIAGVLKAHLDNGGVNLDHARMYASFHDAVDTYVEALAEHAETRR